MKITTKENILKDFKNIIKADFFSVEKLSSTTAPNYVVPSKDGDNYIYIFEANYLGKIAVCVGVQPFGNIVPNKEITRKYENNTDPFIRPKKTTDKNFYNWVNSIALDFHNFGNK